MTETTRSRLVPVAHDRSILARLGLSPDRPDTRAAYVLLAAASGSIPRPVEVLAFTRHWMMYGIERTLPRVSRRPASRIRLTTTRVVDVTNTVEHSFVTGIQRVAKELTKQWCADPNDAVTLVRWDPRGRRLVELTAEERARVLDLPTTSEVDAPMTIVPIGGEFVLPEISTVTRRTEALHTIAAYSGAVTVAIGHDCIPITTTETAGRGMAGAFSRYLAALARFDAVAPVSESSATEFRGWKRMLSGAGLKGPAIHVDPLPTRSAGDMSDSEIERLRREIGAEDDPLVLVVGSREPRKNQTRVLEAAEIAWRTGARFTLVFVGGNAWATEQFDRQLARARRRGRRIITLAGVSDAMIWGLYRTAEFTMFPSLNEGFGLPVVESLSRATPVITSDFGSMRDLGEGNGAVLVDPRDARAIANAMVRLLADPALGGRLRAETSHLPETSWSEYASRLSAIVASSHPDRSGGARSTSVRASAGQQEAL